MIRSLPLLWLALSLAAGLWLAYKVRLRPWPQSLMAFFVPVTFWLCCLQTVNSFVVGMNKEWNEVRLARTFALYSGVPLYPGRFVSGPVMGTLHTPISHLLYGPAILATTPMMAVRIGMLISVLCVFLALTVTLAIANSSNSSSRLARFVFVAFALDFFWLTILNSSIAWSILLIHVDPAALAFATLSGACLYKAPLSRRRLALSAVLSMLAVACKQTFAPAPVALCLYLYLAEDSRTLRRYLLWLAASGVVVGLLLVFLFAPPRDFYFNVVTLAAHRPYWPEIAAILHPSTGGSQLAIARNLLVFIFLRSPNTRSVTVFLPVCLFVACLLCRCEWSQDTGHTLGMKLRRLFATQRWLLFFCIALALFPVLLKASLTMGGVRNHMGAVDFFLLLGLLCGLAKASSEYFPSGRGLQTGTGIQAVLILMLAAMSYAGSWIFFQPLAQESSTTTEQAYRFTLQHPRLAYFPFNPLSSIYAERSFYSTDFSVLDRQTANYPLTQEQYESGIPRQAQLVAIPSQLLANAPPSDALSVYLSRGWTLTSDPALSAFVVYRRLSPAPQPPPVP